MKLNKLFLGLLGLSMLTFAACDDKDDNDYSAPSLPTGSQVFFDSSLPSTINLTKSETTFTIPVNRYITDKELAVQIELTDTNNLFTAPSEVVFNAGDSVAKVVISYDPAKFEYNDYKTATLKLKNDTTPYGISSYTFSAGVALTWRSLGKATYVDNWFEYVTQVDIYVCEQDPSSYRIPAPYADYDGDDYFDMSGEMGDYLYLNILKAGDTFNDVTVTTNGLVTFPIYSTGAIHPSYTDDVIVMLHPSEYSDMAADETKWACNKVVSWADDVTPAQIQLAPSYYMMKHGGWNYTQYDDIIEIYFPGNAPLDYDLTVTYEGKNVTPDDTYTASFSVEAGADLEEVKYALVNSGDVETVLGGILDGSVETESVNGSTWLSFTIEKAGTYSLVAVGYAEGEPQTYDAATILFEMGGGESWTAVGQGIYKYGVEPLMEGAASAYEGSEKAILYQSSIDETRYKIAPWAHWQSDGLLFTWNKETNVIAAKSVDTGEDCIEEGVNYGRILFSDLASFSESFANYPSKYDPESKTFEFWACYHFGEYWFGAIIETFVLTDMIEDEPASARAMKSASRSQNISKRRYVLDSKPQKASLK